MDLPHFQRATRRAFLRRGLAATGGLTAAGVVLAACSESDADVFSATDVGETAATAAPAASTTPAAPSASPTTTTMASPTTPPTESTPAPVATVPDAGRAVDITFSYAAADSSGRVRNPYIAVWVEDADGELVALVGAWYSTRDAKYLRELTDFTAATTTLGSDQIEAVSGATRAAGQYQLHWDGRSLDGAALTGTYALWVEAAREHGPHSVTSGPITLDPANPTTIAGDGELSEIAVTVA